MAVQFVYPLKTRRRFKSCKLYRSSVDKFNVSIGCGKDIYGRYCIQKRNNDYFCS